MAFPPAGKGMVSEDAKPDVPLRDTSYPEGALTVIPAVREEPDTVKLFAEEADPSQVAKPLSAEVLAVMPGVGTCESSKEFNAFSTGSEEVPMSPPAAKTASNPGNTKK